MSAHISEQHQTGCQSDRREQTSPPSLRGTMMTGFASNSPNFAEQNPRPGGLARLISSRRLPTLRAISKCHGGRYVEEGNHLFNWRRC